ncbi:pentatricopeptide repeat-containing protein [Prunus yedoensis var. nudiflora]|uniref:Pentatricopeptide repeat-containing protein n=1 Tax=Prunus yedoensis var. nudiflora TaxID=2094558 RepID=A0A314YU02_PRUYE|nr:pentatricopeptide repeat-containing protein [Prunus yedoensis var. nudiflora]
MREFVILGYSASSSSSIATLPNPHGSNHSTKPYKDKPLSLPKLSPSKSSPPISTLHSAPSLFAVRWDPTKTHLSYFADLASKLARDGKFQDFAMVVESVVLSGVRGSEFTAALKVELVAKGISGLLKEGNVRSVVEVLGKVNELGVPPLKLFDGYAMELLGRQCSRLLKCKQVQELVELMEVLAGFRFPIKELLEPSEVIKLCVDKCCPKLAIRYACIFPHAHILFCNIIYEFGKRKALEPALAAYEASKENLNGSNMYVYRTIIDVCGLCKDYMKSRYIYEDLLKQKNLGVRADMACYNILLKACCLAGRVDLAQDIYREVQHLESTGVLKLDVFTYSTIVKVFADAKLWHMALNVKEDMLSAGVTPNTVTWSSLISACANAGIVEKAIQLFEEMLLAGSEPNSQCFNILLHACVEANQYDRAFRLFQSLKSTKVQETFGKKYKGLSFNPTTTTYNTLMKACGTDYYHAKALLDEMRAVGLYPNQISWSILADICGGSGNVEGALQILKNMRAAGMKPDVVAYTTAIKVCVENENLELALSLFAEMKKYQIHPNLVTYNTLLRARSRYGSVSEVQQCLAIYQDMRKAGSGEGVIQDSNAKQEELSSCNKTDIGRPGSLLLEKVAEHLQTHTAETLAVDLQGLTKVEARIVVLAVLRMIKENYTLGHSVKDDMLIVVGVHEVDGGSTTQNLEVQDAITKLLQDELGLKVLATGAKVGLDTTIEPGNTTDSDQDLEEMSRRDELPAELIYSTRRPVALERLKVTRGSLQHWLRRRSAPRR